MSIVVHGIDAPFVTCAVMVSMQNAVHNWVAELHVWMRHVDFSAENFGTVGKLAGFHASKEVDIVFNRAVAIGRIFTGHGDGAAVLAYFVECLVVYIGKTFFNKLYGP